ncbi:hypothetical protein ACFL4T_13025, partial [candidate division KSB1 bacterium]
MKPRAITIVTILLLLTVVLTSNSYGQGIIWKSNNRGVYVNKTPGIATACTLKFRISTGNHLVQNDWMKIDLSNFQVNTTKVNWLGQYRFRSANTSQTIKMDTTNFDVSWSSTLKELTITLNGENALFPSDSATVIIGNQVLTNLGRGPNRNATNSDIKVRVKTSKQPVYSPSTMTTTIKLNAPNDQQVTTIAPSDANAQEYGRYVITTATTGQIPAGGKFKVDFPYGYTFNASGIDTQDVELYVGGIKKPITDAAFADSSVTITVTNAIASGSAVILNIGSSTYSTNVVRNPSLYPYSGSAYPEAVKSFSTGTNFVVLGLDDVNDTLFYDKAGSDVTYDVVTNWFPADTDSGGVTLDIATAGKSTELSVRFKLGSALDSVDVTDVDTLYLDLSDFQVNADSADWDAHYTIKGASTISDSGDFNALYKGNSIVAFTPGVGGATFPAATQLTIVIDNNVLKNYGNANDVEVKLWTKLQQEQLTDRDVTKIFANTGGVITGVKFKKYDAGEESTIDSLRFAVNGEIPADGYIVVKLPNQFSLPTSIDSARVYRVYAPTAARTEIATITSGTINSGNPLSGTLLQDNEIRLKLSLGGATTISTDCTLVISIGDSTDFATIHRIADPAFTNPAPADSGTYPTIAAGRDNITIETRYSDGSAIQTGTNSGSTVRIVTNAIYADSFGVNKGYGVASAGTVLRKTLPNSKMSGKTYADTVYAGDSLGIFFAFKLGTTLNSASTSRADTFYVDLSDFIVDPGEARTAANYDFAEFPKTVGGTAAGETGTFNQVAYYDGSGIVALTSDNAAGTDALAADSLFQFRITPSGQLETQSWKGLLHAKGSGTATVSWWTNKQRTAVSPAKSLYVMPDSVKIISLTFSDSAAYELSNDVVSLALSGKLLPPNSYAKFTLKEGFSWNSGQVTAANLTLTESKGTGRSAVTKSVSHTASTQITTVTFSDTVFSKKSDRLAKLYSDTLIFTLGGSGTEFIRQIHPDSIFGNGYNRKRVFQQPSVLNKKYLIDIYDGDGNLMLSNNNSSALPSTSGGVLKEDTAAVVTNAFGATDGIWRRKLGNSPTEDHVANKAGDIIDSLAIPFYVGDPIGGAGATITFEFTGVTLANPSVTDQTIIDSTLWAGDTVYSGSIEATVANTFATDRKISFTLGAGDSLGSKPGNKQVTVTFKQLFRNLGRAAKPAYGSAKMDSSDITVQIYTSKQATAVTDTTKLLTSTYLDDVTGELGATTAYTLTTQSYSFAAGDHPGLHPNADFQIKVPINTSDSTDFFYPAAGALDGLSTSEVYVDTGLAGNRDTLTWSTATYNAYTAANKTEADSAYIVIDIGSNQIRRSSPMRVLLNNIFNNPKRASGASADIAGQFASGYIPTGGFKYSAQVLDNAGNTMHHAGNSGTYSVSAGAVSSVLLLVKGETFAPGTSDGKQGTYLADTVNTSIDFALIPVDQYYNRVSSDGGTVIDVNLSSTTDLYSIWNDLSGTAYASAANKTLRLTLDGGAATYYARSQNTTHADSFKFLRAKDNDSNYGRSGYQTMKAVLTNGLTGTVTSSQFSVLPSTAYRLLALFPSQAAYYAPGDTANKGIDPSGGTPSLARGGVYTLNAYVVDAFYNRADTAGAGTAGYYPIDIDAARTSGVNLEITENST